MDDYDYFQNKKTDKIYLSRQIADKTYKRDETGHVREIVRPLRIFSKKMEFSEGHQFIKDGKQVSLRITPGGKQEIIAKFYEDTRGITVLTFQKYTTETGVPHKCYFSFIGNEIGILYNFIRNILLMPIRSPDKDRIDNNLLQEIILSKEQAVELIAKHPDIIREIFENEITSAEIVNLAYRKKQLAKFEMLLNDSKKFEQAKATLGANKRDEDVWQNFFEQNTWIFGYGLDYIFNTKLDNKKLEQITSGSTVWASGKRVDALLKSQGIINALCFAEIKTHKKPLLKRTAAPYRPESWAVSDEVTGGISQLQKTVQRAIQSVTSRIQLKDLTGELTGEEVYLYHPKAFLVVGTLREFEGQHGINEDKYSSFELFARISSTQR
jgi:hypothetical protein